MDQAPENNTWRTVDEVNPCWRGLVLASGIFLIVIALWFIVVGVQPFRYGRRLPAKIDNIALSSAIG